MASSFRSAAYQAAGAKQCMGLAKLGSGLGGEFFRAMEIKTATQGCGYLMLLM